MLYLILRQFREHMMIEIYLVQQRLRHSSAEINSFLKFFFYLLPPHKQSYFLAQAIINGCWTGLNLSVTSTFTELYNPLRDKHVIMKMRLDLSYLSLDEKKERQHIWLGMLYQEIGDGKKNGRRCVLKIKIYSNFFG